MGIHVDTHNKTAKLVRNYVHDPKILANSQGNYQTLSNGDALVGWGRQNLASEFAPHDQFLWTWRCREATSPTVPTYSRGQAKDSSGKVIGTSTAIAPTH